jgi:hypothetical protein
LRTTRLSSTTRQVFTAQYPQNGRRPQAALKRIIPDRG